MNPSNGNPSMRAALITGLFLAVFPGVAPAQGPGDCGCNNVREIRDRWCTARAAKAEYQRIANYFNSETKKTGKTRMSSPAEKDLISQTCVQEAVNSVKDQGVSKGAAVMTGGSIQSIVPSTIWRFRPRTAGGKEDCRGKDTIDDQLRKALEAGLITQEQFLQLLMSERVSQLRKALDAGLISQEQFSSMSDRNSQVRKSLEEGLISQEQFLQMTMSGLDSQLRKSLEAGLITQEQYLQMTMSDLDSQLRKALDAGQITREQYLQMTQSGGNKLPACLKQMADAQDEFHRDACVNRNESRGDVPAELQGMISALLGDTKFMMTSAQLASQEAASYAMAMQLIAAQWQTLQKTCARNDFKAELDNPSTAGQQLWDNTQPDSDGKRRYDMYDLTEDPCPQRPPPPTSACKLK